MMCSAKFSSTNANLVLALALACSGGSAAASERPRDALGLREALRVDVTGDGVPDTLDCLFKGDNRIEARDGKTGNVIWTSTCYMPGWGETNRLGRLRAPFLLDVNGDGLLDPILPARGCGEASIVALDRKGGGVLWQVPLNPLLGKVPGVDDWLVAGDRILLAARGDAIATPGSQGLSHGVVALNPRDGSVLWKSAAPLYSSLLPTEDGALDGLRTDSPESASLLFQPTPKGKKNRFTGEGGSLETTTDLVSEPPLLSLADSVAALIAGPVLIVAGRDHVRAIRLESGSSVWTWQTPGKTKMYGAGLLYREGIVLLAAWKKPGFKELMLTPWSSFSELLLVALDTASGTDRWVRTLDLPMLGRGEVFCTLSINLSDRVVIKYTSPKEKKFPSRVVELDARTGDEVKPKR